LIVDRLHLRVARALLRLHLVDALPKRTNGRNSRRDPKSFCPDSLTLPFYDMLCF